MARSERDARWLEEVYREHAGAVYAFAFRREPQLCDDVLSEVFAVAWRRRHLVPDEALPWLYRVAGNVLHTHRRSRGRMVNLQHKLAAQPIEDADEAGRVADSVDAVGRVRAVLSQLSESDATVLKLWAWEELSHAQIAHVLGCSVGAARVRLSRARKRAARIAGFHDSGSRRLVSTNATHEGSSTTEGARA